MKAVILAAGLGTRLHPVTLTMPKSLVPVANQSLIVYAIEMLKGAGLTEIGIVVHSMRSPICKRLGDGQEFGVNVQYIVQAQQSGLAHATLLCEDFVGDDSFTVFLGDNIFQDDMHGLLTGFKDSDISAAIALSKVPDPERFGIAEVRDGQVIRVEEKPSQSKSNLAICGVYLFRPSIFEAIRTIKPSWRNELEITDAIQALIENGEQVNSYVIDGWWIDAGKPDAIIQANQLVLGDLDYTPAPVDHEAICGDSEVGPRVHLGTGTKVEHSVIRGPVIIGDRVTIRDSYIGPYTSVGDDVIIEGSEIEASIVMRDCQLRNVPGRLDSSLLADFSRVTAARDSVPAVRRFILAENSYIQL
ncbi:MAG: glucose-1-phosphate thymidylyltransferase [Anaerolineaceae bacterium]|nr:glucose-1-phosphate thymidylyltransferase [Anaerolineaceae bacterium]MCY4107123.1 glucose-1-phosphate thymidylyltransferase [Chloroflexota bacterium]